MKRKTVLDNVGVSDNPRAFLVVCKDVPRPYTHRNRVVPEVTLPRSTSQALAVDEPVVELETAAATRDSWLQCMEVAVRFWTVPTERPILWF